jgi:hypothetical protein
MKKSKGLLALLWMLLSLLLPACAPSLTYSEMSEQYLVTEDPEEKAALRERIEKFEQDADASILFFESVSACAASKEHVWFCRGDTMVSDFEMFHADIDKRVRIYRRLRRSCGCAERDEVLKRF